MPGSLVATAFIATVLTGLWITTQGSLPHEVKRKKRVRFMPLWILLISLILPLGITWMADETRFRLERMADFAEAHPEVSGRPLEFRFSAELEAIRHAQTDTDQILKTLAMAPSVIGWSPSRGEVQVSLIQSVKVCHPDHWISKSDLLYGVPMDRSKVKEIMKQHVKGQGYSKSQMFCNFDTLMKLI